MRAMNASLTRDEMLRAFTTSDRTYDGVFLTAVKTTGIFCRPSCPAKKPLPRNVEFFATVREAMFAGYRPCERCRPLEAPGRRPAWVSSLVARVESSPDARLKSSDLLAIGVDPGRARRWFARHFGMTFSAYCRARRLSGALAVLRKGGSVDDAVFESGYQSHSGFRDAFSRPFGATPGKGDAVDAVTLGWIESPLGPLIAGADDRGVCLLEFSDRRMLEAELAGLRRRLGRPLVPGDHPILSRLSTELAEYFGGRRKAFEVPLHAPGTPFQERVWKELLRIPFGEVRSYEEVARRIGAPKAVRAVGRANGMNRVAIVIPCHRVVGKDGSPVGYGGGLRRKQWLLDLERGAPGATQLPLPVAGARPRRIRPTKAASGF
jgi:AraC family transcriptional regulator of adaptative response/methylated-DNA-[protein]-cysteine methyltransferase